MGLKYFILILTFSFFSFSTYSLTIPACGSPNIAFTVSFSRSILNGDQILNDLAVLGNSVHISPEYPRISTDSTSVYFSANNPNYLDTDALRKLVIQELEKMPYEKGVTLICEDE